MLLSGGAAAAPAPDDCARLKALSSARADSEVLGLADACALLPGASEAVRVAALARAADIRSALGDPDGAEAGLMKALALRPSDPELLISMTETIRSRPDDALAFARRAAEAPAPPERRAVALRLLGEIQADLGDEAGARSSLTRSMALAPNDLVTLRSMARLSSAPVNAGSYPDRVERAANAAPDWCRGAAYRFAALIFINAGDDARALKDLGWALGLDPDDIKALRLMVQIRGRRPDLALPAEVEPLRGGARRDELDGLRVRFEAARAAHDPAAAALAEKFTVAAGKAPVWQRYDAYRLSVEMWLSLGNAAQAQGALERLQDRDDQALATLRLWHRVYAGSNRGPGEGEWLAMVVHLRRQLGDEAGAAAAVRRWLERFPDDRGVLAEAAALELADGRQDDALAHAKRLLASYEKATDADMLSIVPDHTYFAGLHVSEREKLQMSLENATMVEMARVQRASGLRAAVEMLARIQVARGHDAEAAAYLNRLEKEALSAAPADRADAYRRSARIRTALGDREGAAASMRLALALTPEDAATLDEAIDAETASGHLSDALRLTDRLEKVTQASEPRQRADAYLKTAKVRSALKDRSGAAESLQRAVALVPDDADALRELVSLELARGRPNQALPYAERLEKVAEVKERDPRRRADSYRKTAQVKSALKDADGAAASLQKALDASPRDADTLREFIALESSRGRPQEALKYADRLLAALEDAPAAERAAAYRSKAGVQRELKDDGGAASSLQAALALAPGDAELSREASELESATLRASIEAALAKGQPAQALSFAQRRAKVLENAEPRVRADAYRKTAEIERALGDESAAMADLQRAQALAPADARDLRETIAAELAAGRPGKALTAGPHDAGSLQDSIERALAQGHPRDALADADRLVAAAKDASAVERAEAYRRKAAVQHALADATGEEDSLRRALEAAPRDARVLRAWSEFQAGLGRPTEARDALRRALEASPGEAETLRLLLDSSRDKPAEALASFSAAPPDGGARAQWLALRAQARALAKDDAAARADMDSALAADAKAACYSPVFSRDRDRLEPVYFDACVTRFPQDAGLYADRGVALFSRGRVDDSVRDFRKTVALKPDEPDGYLSLASVLVSAKRPEEASVVLEQAAARFKRGDGPVFDQLRSLRESLRPSASKP
jgi:Tfp pilus assembly protein PilF